MNRTFCVTLNREEYLEYLSYQLMQSGHMRGSRWFLLTSVPAVLITGMLLLPYKKMLFFTCVLALAALWILYGAGAVWKSYVRRKAERYYWPKLNIREFQEVRYRFSEEEVEVKEAGKRSSISYSDFQVPVPLKESFILYHGKGAFLLPYRLFEDEADMKEFLREYEKRRGAAGV
ncbi:MAG: YcxB family protein [Lachnospiraceae bacterium]|jgi:hypothetical protein|nr:YcxB family protein [Lachnospiraceae bacterium]